VSHVEASPVPSASKPVLVVLSVLAGLNVVNGGLGALDVVPAQVVGLIALGTAAVTTGLMFYLQGVVVPANAVAARVTGDGQLVSGPADQTIPTGTQVQLTPTADGDWIAPSPD
jgi:hypothetical protein